ncbi:hypothetical protein [Atopococcus tabaci]|uniref:hypothetical protein n=1 Tax=Atopococcus tabaci TaxID=269774 RepID=UPI0003FA7199|nr:hypothetical protein [Atopococcus tabaci]
MIQKRHEQVIKDYKKIAEELKKDIEEFKKMSDDRARLREDIQKYTAEMEESPSYETTIKLGSLKQGAEDFEKGFREKEKRFNRKVENETQNFKRRAKEVMKFSLDADERLLKEEENLLNLLKAVEEKHKEIERLSAEIVEEAYKELEGTGMYDVMHAVGGYTGDIDASNGISLAQRFNSPGLSNVTGFVEDLRLSIKQKEETISKQKETKE